MKNLEVLPSKVGLNVHQYSLLFGILGTDQCKLFGWALLTVCLTSVYLTSLHVTKSPKPSLSNFAYYSNVQPCT